MVFDFRKFLVAGILGGIVIFIVSWIVDYFTQMVWPYNVLELGGMRAVTDPVMLLFFLHAWVMAFALAFVYPYLKGNLEGTIGHKGAKFGFIAWIVASIPSAFIVYTSMNYPIGFTFNSVVGSLLYMLAAGITIARFME